MTTAHEYRGPVRPSRVAQWDRWCGTGSQAGRSQEWRDGFNHAMQAAALWLDFQVSRLPDELSSTLPINPGVSSAGMYKSHLLGRLMRGEEVRRRSCPTHHGRLQLGGAVSMKSLECCDGTGWLRNVAGDPESERYQFRDEHRIMHAYGKPWWREEDAGDAP